MSAQDVDAVSVTWPQQVAIAKIAWARLSEDELLLIEGVPEHLVDLVQARYAISREEAQKQVTHFFRYC